jgi:homoserine kinase
MTGRRESPKTFTPVSVRVPASASNLGAGFDCLGLALDLWLEARLVAGTGPPRYAGTLATLRADQDVIWGALGGRVPPDCHLEVHSEIPISRGLGSSGAAAVAGAVLASLVQHKPIDRQFVYETARQIEGHPDNVGPAAFGGLVLATERPSRIAIDTRFGLGCTVPETPIDTRAARAMLPAQIARDTAVAQAARAAALLLGLSRGDADLVRFGMKDLIAVPCRKDLIMGFEEAVSAGLASGAYGVTISGSGSTLIAVCPVEVATRVAMDMSEALGKANNPAVPLVPQISDRGFQVEPAASLAR